MFKALKAKPFWVHLLLIIALVMLLLFGFLQLLGLITQHGKYLTVPAVVNKKTAEAVKLLEAKGFEVVIQDSIYTDTAKMGTVLKQFPESNSTVKINRVVLLTVNRVTLPMVDMPALQGKSMGYALELLKRSHLLLGDTTFKSSFMLNAVLEQSFHGTVINSGSKIPWGSRIDLLIGSGNGENEFPVPDLIGMTYSEAKGLLEGQGILVGSVPDQDVTDTANSFVWRQQPPPLTTDKRIVFIRSGQVLDLWLSRVMRTETDSTKQTNIDD